MLAARAGRRGADRVRSGRERPCGWSASRASSSSSSRRPAARRRRRRTERQMGDIGGWVIIGIVVLVALFLVFSIVHIVREYERLVVFLFGRLQGARGP